MIKSLGRLEVNMAELKVGYANQPSDLKITDGNRSVTLVLDDVAVPYLFERLQEYLKHRESRVTQLRAGLTLEGR